MATAKRSPQKASGMTGHRAALALVALALLGPAVAIGMTLLVGNSLAGDSFGQGRLETLWILSAAWAVVCLVGAYTQWTDRG